MEHIKMPRGDLKNVHFTVHDANDSEVSKGFTQITFTVKANTSSRKIVIQKKLTNGTTKVPKATNADTVGGFTVGVSVPANAKFTDTTYSDMKAATASAAGAHGLVPAPAAGKHGQYLRGDGQWATPTNTDTHYTAKNVVGSSATAQSNVTAATANPYLNLVENGAVRSSHHISGSGATTVKTDASGNIVISSVNTTYDLSGYLKKTDMIAITNSEIDTIIAS